jgi:hypothetical protein
MEMGIASSSSYPAQSRLRSVRCAFDSTQELLLLEHCGNRFNDFNLNICFAKAIASPVLMGRETSDEA